MEYIILVKLKFLMTPEPHPIRVDLYHVQTAAYSSAVRRTANLIPTLIKDSVSVTAVMWI